MSLQGRTLLLRITYESTDVAKICAGFLNTNGHCLFTFSHPDARIVKLNNKASAHVSFKGLWVGKERYLLVRLVMAFMNPNLGQEVVFILKDKVAGTISIFELGI